MILSVLSPTHPESSSVKMSSLSISTTSNSDVAAASSSTFSSSSSPSLASVGSSSSLTRALVPDLMSLVMTYLNYRDFTSAQRSCRTFHRVSHKLASTLRPDEVNYTRVMNHVREASQLIGSDDVNHNIPYHTALLDIMRIFAPRRRSEEEVIRMLGEVPIIPTSTRSIALWDDLYLSEVNAFMQSIQSEGQVETLIEVSPRFLPSLYNSHVPRGDRVGLPKNNNEKVRAFFSSIASSLRVFITFTTFYTIDLSPLTRLRVLCIPSVDQTDHLDEMHELESLEVISNSEALMIKVRWLSSHHSLTYFSTRGWMTPEALGYLCGFSSHDIDADQSESNHFEAVHEQENAQYMLGSDVDRSVRNPNSLSTANLHHIKSDQWLHPRENEPVCKLSHIGFTYYHTQHFRNWFLYLLSVHLPHITSISAPGFNTRLHTIFSPVLIKRYYLPLLQLTPEHEIYMKERLAKMTSVMIRYDRFTEASSYSSEDPLCFYNGIPLLAPSLTRLHVHDFEDLYSSNLMLKTAFPSLIRLEYLTIQPKPERPHGEDYNHDTISQMTFLAIRLLTSLRVLSLSGEDVRLLWNDACFETLAALPHFESWQIDTSRVYVRQRNNVTPPPESLELTSQMLKWIASSQCWYSIVFTSHEVNDWYLPKRTPKNSIDHELKQLTQALLESKTLRHFRVEFNEHVYRIQQEKVASNTTKKGNNSSSDKYCWLRVWDGTRRRFVPKQTKQSKDATAKQNVEGGHCIDEEAKNCRCVVC